MIVKELFQKADWKIIAKEIADNDYMLSIDQTKTEEEKEIKKMKYAEIIIHSVQEMLKLEEIINEENILAVMKVIALDEPDNTYYTASLIKKSDLMNKEIRYVNYDDKDTDQESFEEIEKKYVQTYAFEFNDWKEILGYSVSDVSIKEYGLNVVVSAIFDEMTFFGLEYEKVNERTEEEMNILDERIKEIEEHPENLKPISEVFEKFGLEPETQEEIERRKKELLEEMKLNQEITYSILKKMKDEYYV